MVGSRFPGELAEGPNAFRRDDAGLVSRRRTPSALDAGPHSHLCASAYGTKRTANGKPFRFPTRVWSCTKRITKSVSALLQVRVVNPWEFESPPLRILQISSVSPTTPPPLLCPPVLSLPKV